MGVIIERACARAHSFQEQARMGDNGHKSACCRLAGASPRHCKSRQPPADARAARADAP